MRVDLLSVLRCPRCTADRSFDVGSNTWASAKSAEHGLRPIALDINANEMQGARDRRLVVRGQGRRAVRRPRARLRAPQPVNAARDAGFQVDMRGPRYRTIFGAGEIGHSTRMTAVQGLQATGAYAVRSERARRAYLVEVLRHRRDRHAHHREQAAGVRVAAA
jgi:hypothetical protein